MTSGSSDKVSSQGDVRIWAGTNDKNASNIAEAPFTVTDKGVLTCRGNDGNIVLKDGTIYFIVGGTEYKLGITNGKPDWINSAGADSVETWYRKEETSTNITFSASGSFSVKDNVYYIDGTMHSTVSGTYYKRISHAGCLYYIGSQLFIAFHDTLGVEVYMKATFNNGAKTINGIVAISGFASPYAFPTDSNPGKITVNNDRKQWCSIEKKDKDSIFNMYHVQGFGSADKFG
jgi:hypothetical protein